MVCLKRLFQWIKVMMVKTITDPITDSSRWIERNTIYTAGDSYIVEK